MLNYSGKTVDYLRVVSRITRGRLSTLWLPTYRQLPILGGQAQFIHQLSDQFIPHLSTPKFAISPLIQHYLYPVSTAPINNPTKRKFKERY